MALLLLVSISLVLFTSIQTTTHTQAWCHPEQHATLIKLKQGLNTTELQSWNSSTDCCTWDGVTCDKQTGLVTALDLSDRSISGELNLLLFNLSSLQHLNLANNNFNNNPLPQSGFEQLINLTHLNLSNAGFGSQVPIGISVLKNLISLDLSTYSYEISLSSLYLHDPGLETLLTNLTKLQILWLDGVNISSNGSTWGNAISRFGQNLQELSMQGCSLTGPIDTSLIQLKQLKLLRLDNNFLNSTFPVIFANYSSLTILSLSSCELKGYLPNEIFHHTNLTELDLSNNPWLSGQLPKFTKGSILQQLYLSVTNFTGPIPESIRNLQYLSILDLSESSFNGEVPGTVANLTRLTHLYLWGNRFTGMIPMSLFSHPSLSELLLSENQFSGYLLEFSNVSSTLEVIDLGTNNIQGGVPISIFKLPQLSELSLTSNNFTGVLNLDLIKHMKTKYLNLLDLSNNKLSIIEGKNHNKSFYTSFPYIYSLNLASCNLKKFPSFLSTTQVGTSILDLSNNKIDGIIPNWLLINNAFTFLNLSHNLLTKIEGDRSFMSQRDLFVLDINSNMIVGSVPVVPLNIMIMDFSFNFFFRLSSHFPSSLLYLSLSNNRLTEEIPLSICNATNLEVLDLSYNNLFGTVPPCLLQGANALGVLNIKSNKLSGRLPQDISQACGLRTINLNGNGINGSLPKLLMNCKALEVLDLGNNRIVNRFPYWLGNLENLRVLVLRSNMFYGNISEMEIKITRKNSFFPMLKILDISSNRFGGTLPKNFFVNLKAMMSASKTSSLTISYELNYYQGMDLSYYQNSVTITYKGLSVDLENSLGIFSSLDLSNNDFSGEISEEIGQLKLLNLLNLSHNALNGSIPPQFGNLEQLESLDLSYNQLSGHIPQELTFLTFLASLNLSYNNLIGEIPQARQFSTFSNDSYLGNLGLCGSPLWMQCTTIPSSLLNVLPSNSSTDLIEIAVPIGLGFGVGFTFVIWALLLWDNGRKCFDYNVDRFYFRHMYQS